MNYISEQDTVLSRMHDDFLRNERMKPKTRYQVMDKVTEKIVEEIKKKESIQDTVPLISWEEFQLTKMFNKTYL